MLLPPDGLLPLTAVNVYMLVLPVVMFVKFITGCPATTGVTLLNENWSRTISSVKPLKVTLAVKVKTPVEGVAATFVS